MIWIGLLKNSNITGSARIGSDRTLNKYNIFLIMCKYVFRFCTYYFRQMLIENSWKKRIKKCLENRKQRKISFCLLKCYAISEIYTSFLTDKKYNFYFVLSMIVSEIFGAILLGICLFDWLS